MKLLGTSIIGSRRGVSTGTTFHAFEPRTGQPLAPEFFYAPADEIETSVRLAHKAFAIYGHLPGTAKASFLRAIAARIGDGNRRSGDLSKLVVARVAGARRNRGIVILGKYEDRIARGDARGEAYGLVVIVRVLAGDRV